MVLIKAFLKYGKHSLFTFLTVLEQVSLRILQESKSSWTSAETFLFLFNGRSRLYSSTGVTGAADFSSLPDWFGLSSSSEVVSRTSLRWEEVAISVFGCIVRRADVFLELGVWRLTAGFPFIKLKRALNSFQWFFDDSLNVTKKIAERYTDGDTYESCRSTFVEVSRSSVSASTVPSFDDVRGSGWSIPESRLRGTLIHARKDKTGSMRCTGTLGKKNNGLDNVAWTEIEVRRTSLLKVL